MARTALLPILAALPLAGCASASMTVPAELEEVSPLVVEGREGWFAADSAVFGIWRAVDLDRSWTRGSGWGVQVGPLGGGRDRGLQEYSFRFFEDGTDLGTIGCVAVGSQAQGLTRVVGVQLAAREALECRPIQGPWAAADTAAGEPGWDLVVEASGNRHLEGFVRGGDERLAVASTGPGGGIAPATAYGFEIRDGERVVAAVETVNRGSVRLAPWLTQERRSQVAAAAAALLLYERIRPGD